MKLIDKAAIVAEIEKLISNGQVKLQESQESNDNESYVACAEHIATCIKILSLLDTLEVKKVDLEKEEDKLDKAMKLADAMYDAAQQLTTDASKLHKAMQDWWNFKNNKL